MMSEIDSAEIDRVYHQLKTEAEASGYHLNPDVEFTRDLIRGLLTNEKRFGYRACPCRLASGRKAEDLDIICPCDWRDPDLDDHGACYCALYVSAATARGEKKATPVPERRPPAAERGKNLSAPPAPGPGSLPFPVWRCKVCGYLCARASPPEVCPICKVKNDRFEKFLF